MVRILLVEDDEMSRELLSRRLKKLGYTVFAAVNGLDGFHAARAEIPDVILMDLCMPELDGISAIRKLRADDTTSAIPIIALTALASPSDVQKAIDAGCNQYETKPVHMDRLAGKINAVLTADRRPAELEPGTSYDGEIS
ncbi:MAG: response regulator [Acidobacteriia bacterium]|nr:response regulator [Terriglobia bacterium]